MRLAHAYLVILDISGYTNFITQRTVSLLHAEQIISTLMETVIDLAEHPLQVNKLEGDAALLYRECEQGDSVVAKNVFAQIKAFFPAFYHCLAQQRESRANCSCEACTNIDNLALKAFVHSGEIAIKQVRQFEELAGEDVILIHRMLKNHVPTRDYILISEIARAGADLHAAHLQSHNEELEGIGPTELWLTDWKQIQA
ncbi:MAG: DUF2652 domain-containing protein [Arenimonas sp.]